MRPQSAQASCGDGPHQATAPFSVALTELLTHRYEPLHSRTVGPTSLLIGAARPRAAHSHSATDLRKSLMVILWPRWFDS